MLAATFSVFAVIQYAVDAQAMEERYHVGLLKVVATYAFGGALGGTIVGLLLPMARWKAGAGMLGVIAVLPLAVMIQYTTMGPSRWSLDNTIVVVLGSLLLGIPLGIMEHESLSRDAQPHDAR